jgi:2-dehydro-3-deoxyphosphogluconate aldolase/(4S)-4-hydroxy-2-oxoglutarate aldolase
MKEIYQKLYEIGIIPVIKIENPDDAVPLAKALIDGGLPAAEITFRTACAKEAIKKITEAYPDKSYPETADINIDILYPEK